MADTPQKRKFYGIISGKIKAFIFIILVGVAIAFWLFTQSIFSQVREFHREVIKKQVNIYLSIIDPYSTFDAGIDTRLFENVIVNVQYPGIFTDENLNPVQRNWHNVGIAPDDTSEVSHNKLRKLVKKMDAINPPEQFIMPSLVIRTDTLTVYELPAGKDVPLIVTDEAGNCLYLRNTRIALADTVEVKAVIERIDSYSRPFKFQKDNEPTLVFHSTQPPSSLPIIVVKNHLTPLYWRNIDEELDDTTAAGRTRLSLLLKQFSEKGIVYEIVTDHKIIKDKILLYHYGDLPFIRLIGWLPLIEFLVILILISIGFMGFINIKNAEQRSIWVGMAKETAHQLGTPISSLSGWLELLKNKEDRALLDQALPDMEYDVKRLTRVAERFSNVGSMPELKPIDISDVIDEVLEYYRARLPRIGGNIVINSFCDGLRPVMANRELLNWAFENLIKNSLSAVNSRNGQITINGMMSKDFRKVILDFKDNGKGIAVADQKKVMKPGFTSKKRGWGLGLSLVKRIIADYHGGKVFLLESRPSAGTTFRIMLPAIREGKI